MNSPTCPPEFVALVTVLRELRLKGIEAIERKELREPLLSKDSLIFLHASIHSNKKLKNYVKRAKELGIVTVTKFSVPGRKTKIREVRLVDKYVDSHLQESESMVLPQLLEAPTSSESPCFWRSVFETQSGVLATGEGSEEPSISDPASAQSCFQALPSSPENVKNPVPNKFATLVAVLQELQQHGVHAVKRGELDKKLVQKNKHVYDYITTTSDTKVQAHISEAIQAGIVNLVINVARKRKAKVQLHSNYW